MTNEDFYVYILSHTAHHFETAGTGIKTIIDHYYLKKKLKPLCNHQVLDKALSDAEIIDYLMDDETNILFFSPCGLEIGINYMQDAIAWGWVTVTLREMGDVLIDDSYDFIKPAKGTWVAPNGEPYDLDEALKEYQDAYNEKNGLSDDYDDIFDEEFPEDDSDDGFVLPPEYEDAGDL